MQLSKRDRAVLVFLYDGGALAELTVPDGNRLRLLGLVDTNGTITEYGKFWITFDAERRRGKAWRSGKQRMPYVDATSYGQAAHQMMSKGQVDTHPQAKLIEAAAVLWEALRAARLELAAIKDRAGMEFNPESEVV